ncbi:membrane-bound PQQ-dependent dehydrogenase, glucose/quinate/shikimate family [Xanthomonas arboricola pv. juglandis]|uniref:membrane-bound PQQ-dependent dehydrogenase, glucose/quinate/shikimate family n=1 Tax=Xanthomonas TaxID=338 RepID=UPI000E5B76B5|nr:MULTISPECIES: membrane-bound PQQ-dependent dehydrogenase, glucose/quinate/shikimate family [Xanthomonas]CAD1790550.1 membrane-bound PQQ-dependent dehydrogenase, glucose/quinate/shikimate family [Xanthomonas sp. CPBF 426]CAG2088342.1 membrane-bound PQQ-dependent dehydrogenase, glucose/quinate/shikimate family [Xanthomonas euroxanthea]SYZ54565.1 membrane-bound PQQ-dependent dehydrogenase, glucose/quinate/shikimate family [Xanthomonas arboricola pv. juglandis]
MTTLHRPSRRGHWALATLGGVIGVLGTVLLAGGVWLAALGGSWYYAPAGAALLIAGVLLFRGRNAGAWWFAAVVAASLLWTWWESGSDYWRWVPRLGLIVGLAFVLALLLPKLERPVSRAVSRSVAGVLAAVFVVAFALAFVPFGVTEADGVLAHAAGMAAGLVKRSASASPAVSDGQPANAPADDDWAAYGRSQAGQRYSPLQQINRDNVAQLTQAWVFHTGDLPSKRWGAETTPLKVGDSLYLCTARNQVIALDAASGKERWRYDPKVKDEAIPYTAACRGVSYYQVPAAANDAAAAAAADASALCRTRIIEGTLDGRLIALDARSGKPCTDFGNNGQVAITAGMGQTPPGYVSINSPPAIVRGVVVTGHQVLDGQKRYEPSGVIEGFDAVTGQLRWAWDMTHPDWNGAPPPGQTWTRGTPNMWTTAAADEQLGYVYLPMGNSTADYWSSSRTPQENRYATSLVALDVITGRPVWNFQTTHIDTWDYDLGSQPSLIDFPKDGVNVPAVLLPSKQGELYVLDRRTGKPLVGVEERAVPGGGVEPQMRARTQPFSLYHTLRKPDLTERDMWGMTPIDQLVCRIQFRKASYKGIYTPPEADRHSIEYPGYNGGSDWGSVSVDPQRGVIVANYNDMPNYNLLVPRAKADKLGWAPRDEVRGDTGGAEGAGDPQAGTPYAINVNAGWRLPFTKLLCKQPPYGGIRAIDLASGKTLWDRPFGSARGNGPFGIRSGLPIEIGTPNNGGSVVTAGGLIFIAAATDALIRAIDLATGKELWHAKLPAGGQANPMVYAYNGREYLVIMAGGHHFMETPAGDAVVAYALPQKAP